jgi:hypothetical protein
MEIYLKNLRILTMRAIRRILSPLKNKTLKSLLIRQHDQFDFCSHAPVLLYLIKNFAINKVCESGSGYGSTPILSDETLNPNLVEHKILETNPEWAARIASLVQGKPASEIVEVDKPADFFSTTKTKFDLMFLDDSNTTTERAVSISAALRLLDDKNFLIIHDFEHKAYRRCIPDDVFLYEIDSIKPFTGLVTKSTALNKLVKTVGKVQETIFWSELLDKEFPK